MKYDYHCPHCDTTTELTMSMKDDIPQSIQCKNCGKDANRVYSAAPIHGFRQGPKIMYNE